MPQVEVIKPIRQHVTAKLRVCAYARVSTDSADQLNSFASQVQYYTNYIESRADWELVDIYADRGITGTDAHKRDEFLRMMEDCRKRKIDQILVKSLSRFARNTADCIAAIRELRQLGVTVIFEKERINTRLMANEMLISMMSAFAQEESVSIAKNLRKGILMRMNSGNFRLSNLPYGYDHYENGRLSVQNGEAKAIRWIYDRYLSGYGVNQIARELPCQLPAEARIRGSKNGILYILSNERYMGDELLRKSFTSDTVPFRKIMNCGQQDQVYIRHSHEPIIEAEKFHAVQTLLAERRGQFGCEEPRKTYLLTGKLICKSCGAPLYRRVTGKGICWICKNHVYHPERCTEKGYSEAAVLQGARCLCRKLRTYSKELLQWYLQTLLKIESHDRACRPQVQDLYQTINDILIQSHTLQRLYASGCIDSGFFISRKNELDHQLTENKARLHEAKATLCGDIIRQTRIMMDALEQDATPTDEVIWGQLIVKAAVGEGRISFSMLNGLELTSPLEEEG